MLDLTASANPSSIVGGTDPPWMFPRGTIISRMALVGIIDADHYKFRGR